MSGTPTPNRRGRSETSRTNQKPNIPAAADGTDLPQRGGTFLDGSTRGPAHQVWKRAFLAALAITGNVSASARAAGIERASTYAARNVDDAFAAAWEDAMEQATDALELEARRRAADGMVRKKFTSKGDPIIDPETGLQYIEHEYSDTLMCLLLKAHRPVKFRELRSVMNEGDVEFEIDRGGPPPDGVDAED